MKTAIACAAVVAVGLAGCAMRSAASAPSPPPAPALDAGDFLPGAGRSVLVVARDRGGLPSSCVHRVSIDGKAAADLHAGEWVTLYPLPGRHVIGVHMSGGGCSGDSSLTLMLAGHAEQMLRTRVDAGGTLAIVAAPR